MRRLGIEVFTALTLTLGAILALTLNVRAAEVAVSNAFARASATAAAKSGAVYMTIVNNGAEADRLLGVRTDAAAHAMLHQTVTEEGVTKMTMAHDVEIPAGGQLAMSPGGSHIMLMGLTRPLKQGEAIMLKLTFEKAGEVSVSAKVGSVAAMTP